MYMYMYYVYSVQCIYISMNIDPNGNIPPSNTRVPDSKNLINK